MSFKIYIDSAGNIPAVKVKEYDINVVSFINYVNGEELVCFNPDLTPEEEIAEGKKYYNAVRSGAEVKTSLVNAELFMNAFEEALKEDNDIIYICLSKNISGTCQAATIAANELLEKYPERKIEIVDALNASLGQGLHAIKASILRKQGVEFDEIVRILRADVPKMNGLFTVDDLKYLAKTGRINSAMAFAGNMLNIKPILRGNAEGFIVEFKKVRGRKKSLEELIRLTVDNIENPEDQIIGLAHADAYDTALMVADRIKSATNVKEIIITAYDYCTGSHVGPDTIALFFLAKDRELKGR